MDIVTEPHPVGGWQEARCERVRELLARTPAAWCPDQYNNPDNVAAYAPLALELVVQLGRIDVLVAAVGTGGHSVGIARTLRTFNPELKLVGVDSVSSTVFGQPAGPRLMRGLGSSIYPRNIAYETFDEVHWVAPGEAVWACRGLAAGRYATGGWSVGAVAQVASWIARTEPSHVRTAAIFPDGPQRYFDTVYNDAYCAEHGLLDVEPATDPDEIAHPAEHEVTRWTRCTTVIDPLAGQNAGRAAGEAPRRAPRRGENRPLHRQDAEEQPGGDRPQSVDARRSGNTQRPTGIGISARWCRSQCAFKYIP
jgi:cysteine synthase A